MNILLVRKYPRLDGTHTLFLRMARELKCMGHQVYFLQFQDIRDSLIGEIDGYVTLLKEEDLHSGKPLPVVDAIHGISEGDLLWWTFWFLKNKKFPQARVVIGFYHPRVFWEPSFPIPSPDALIYRRFFHRVPGRNLLFMNEEVKRSHEGYFGRVFADSPIIPIPVSVPERMPERTQIKKGKIVSIGRLVDFKNYVEYLIDVILALRSKGNDVELHIYGDGPLRARIEQKIGSLGLDEYVFLEGEISYGEIPAVLADAFLFIGMGTSVVEAAGHGVPSLVAIENNTEATTYGWFFGHEGYHVGEQVKGWELFSFESMIELLLTVEERIYQSIGVQCREKATQFSPKSIMDQYCHFLEHADPSFTIRFGGARRIALRLARQPFKLIRYFYDRKRYGNLRKQTT